jgi:hypothetical protein
MPFNKINGSYLPVYNNSKMPGDQNIHSFKIQIFPPHLYCNMRDTGVKVDFFDGNYVHFVFSNNPNDHISLATILGKERQKEDHLINATQDEIDHLKEKALKLFFKYRRIKEEEVYFLPDTVKVIREQSKLTLKQIEK